MKFAAKALLILTTFAGLGALAVRNIMQAVAIERHCSQIMMTKRRLDDIARQESKSPPVIATDASNCNRQPAAVAPTAASPAVTNN